MIRFGFRHIRLGRFHQWDKQQLLISLHLSTDLSLQTRKGHPHIYSLSVPFCVELDGISPHSSFPLHEVSTFGCSAPASTWKQALSQSIIVYCFVLFKFNQWTEGQNILTCRDGGMLLGCSEHGVSDRGHKKQRCWSINSQHWEVSDVECVYFTEWTWTVSVSLNILTFLSPSKQTSYITLCEWTNAMGCSRSVWVACLPVVEEDRCSVCGRHPQHHPPHPSYRLLSALSWTWAHRKVFPQGERGGKEGLRTESGKRLDGETRVQMCAGRETQPTISCIWSF